MSTEISDLNDLDDSFIKKYEQQRLQELKQLSPRRDTKADDLEKKCSLNFHDHFAIMIGLEFTETCYGFDNVYELGQVIGEGSFGKVVKCRNKLTGNTVALKIQKGAEQNNVNMFRKELENLKKILKTCQSFVCIEGWGLYKGKIFIAMNYLQGKTLTDYIEENDTKMSYSEFKELANQLVSEVDSIHEQGLAHTDIKPDNIMIHNGQLRIIDFGLGCSKDSGCHSGGTPKYMPHDLDTTFTGRQKADWYALAMTLTELAVNSPIYLANFQESLEKYVETLNINKDTKEYILDVLDRAI